MKTNIKITFAMLGIILIACITNLFTCHKNDNIIRKATINCYNNFNYAATNGYFKDGNFCESVTDDKIIIQGRCTIRVYEGCK